MRENRKILLITPPFYRLYKGAYSLDRYPLSLGYLAGAVSEKTSWEVMAYNADFCPESEPLQVSFLAGQGFDNYLKNLKNPDNPIWDEVRSVIREFAPSVVGLSCMTQNFKSACNIAEIVKKLNPNTHVVLGGPHASMLRSEVLDCPHIDMCVVGEGEETIVELLNAIDGKKGFDHVKGIIFRRNGNVAATPPRELIKNLDSLCIPHKYAPRVLKDYDKYPPEAFKYVFATRGCPFDCLFCGSRYIWGRKPRYRSADNVVEELKSLRETGVESVRFEDDNFGIRKSYLLELCDKIKAHCPGLQWACEMHVKCVDEPNLSAMKASGCVGITLGIESGNNSILKKIRKKNSIEDCFRAAEIIQEHDISLGAFFMVGFPWETEKTLKDTIQAMKKLNCDVPIYSIFTPYKGTEAFDLCKEMGLIAENYDFSLYNHQSPLNCFCKDISKERFREICSKIERMTDREGIYYKVRDLVSLKTLRKIRKRGLKTAMERGIGMIRATISGV